MKTQWTVSFLILLLSTLFLAGCDEDTDEESTRRDDTPRQADEPLPYSTTSDYLTVKVEGEYRPIFIRGMNLGVAKPGTLAGELAATDQDYRRWLDMMRQWGINVLRIYTLHYPRFYEALDEHNRTHPDNPIYVLHGIWLDEESSSSDDLFDMTAQFRAGMHEVVDAVHGNRSIRERRGRAFGEYEIDISQWVLGWIVGREVHPEEVLVTNEANSHIQSFDGEAFRVEEGDAVEVWWARHLDTLVTYERDFYGVQRPVSVSSWPSLDPLDHPTEGSYYSSEDVASFDATRIEPIDAPAGIFATYHAYPYYPDYIVDDPDYRQFADDEGPNSYMGYLFRLKDHYRDIPLLIGEVGVPSSWGSAHWGHENMDHGGHDELEQGEVARRLFHTIHDTNCAGGALFAWIDEWWKPTWITDHIDFGLYRRKTWHNVTAAEQNFGLIAFDLGAPDFSDFGPVSATGDIESVQASADAAFFHVRLNLRRSLTSDDRLIIGYDTYRDDLGESILPDGVQTQNRNEFALVIDPDEAADLQVTLAYDLFGRFFYTSDEGQKYRSTATDGGPWRLIRWQNNQPRGSNDGTYWFDPTYHDIGHLRIRRHDQPETSHDAVVLYPEHIDIRIPWVLLNVAHPGLHEVVHDDRDDMGRFVETTITEGFALSVTLNEELLVETDRFLWEGWTEAPETTERVKPGAAVFSEAMHELPYWMD